MVAFSFPLGRRDEVPKVIHLKNFMGPGTLCGIGDPAPDEVTLRPEKVTCARCLTMMGRRTANRR
jgi:hypothetical protein